MNIYFPFNRRLRAFAGQNIVLCVVCALALGLAAGCRNAPQRPADRMERKVAELEQEIKHLRFQIKLLEEKDEYAVIATQKSIAHPTVISVYKRIVIILLLIMHIFFIVVIFVGLFRPIFRAEAPPHDKFERFRRVFALFIGFIFYYTFRYTVISIPTYIFTAIDVDQPFNIFSTSVTLPLLVITIAIVLFSCGMKWKKPKLIRFNIIIGSFIVTLFTEILVYAIAADAWHHPKLLTANFVFILGTAVFIIFFHKNTKPLAEEEET